MADTTCPNGVPTGRVWRLRSRPDLKVARAPSAWARGERHYGADRHDVGSSCGVDSLRRGVRTCSIAPITWVSRPAKRAHHMSINRADIVRRCFATLALLAAMTAVAAIAAHPVGAVTNCSPSSSWGTNRADLASQVVNLINQYRSSKGLSQLVVSSPLVASSEWKSLHMAGYGYFDHNDQAPPVSRTAYQRVTDCGYSGNWWGENIAWGYTSAQSVVNGWLGSSGHKANIENPNFTSTGVGVAANAAGQLYWTQSFGNDVASGTPPSPTPSTPPSPAPTPPPPATTPPPPPATTPPPPPATTPPPAAPPASTSPAPVVTTPSPPTLAIASAGATAAEPLGGTRAHVTRQKERSRLTASVAFVTLSTGRPLTAGSVRCRAEVAGRALPVVINVFKAQAALCSWRVPGWARGKQATGIVAVRSGDMAAKRLFVRRIA